jgi:hypothetical protein
MGFVIAFVILAVIVGLFLYEPPKPKPKTGQVIGGLLIGGALAAAAAIAVVAVITWGDLQAWFAPRLRTDPNLIGKAIREAKANGSVSVVALTELAGVVTDSKTYESPKGLSPELAQRFGDSNTLIVHV